MVFFGIANDFFIRVSSIYVIFEFLLLVAHRD